MAIIESVADARPTRLLLLADEDWPPPLDERLNAFALICCARTSDDCGTFGSQGIVEGCVRRAEDAPKDTSDGTEFAAPRVRV